MRDKVLIVDDVELNRDILDLILKDEYEILKAEDGKQALQMIRENEEEIAVILLDLVMPEMDGLEVLREIKANYWTDQIPVLIISGENSADIEEKCYDYDVSDFIRKPFVGEVVKKRIRNIVHLFAYKSSLEVKIQEQTEKIRAQYKLVEEQKEKLRQNNAKILDVLGTVVEYRNLESGEHINRVKGFTKILAEQVMKDYPEYGLTPEKIEMIADASALHDIGKIAIPDHVLLKPGKLTDEEFEEMKTHTTQGCEILESIEGAWDDDYGKLSYDICRHHHERHDGKGYPDGLAGDEIPLAAQLVSVADVYDALVSEGVYKKAFSRDEAYHMIQDGKCGTFSPKMMAAFEHAREAFEELADQRK